MNDPRRLGRRRDRFRIERYVAKQQIRLVSLDETGALQLPRHVAGAGGASANAEPAGKLGLARGGQRRAFFVSDADPFDLAVSNRIRKRIEGIANQSKNVADSDLFENADQKFRNRL